MKKENLNTEDSKLTANELLDQYYLSAKDLTVIIPNLKIEKARIYISEIQKEMKDKGIFVPETRTKVALTKLVKKKFGL